MREGAGSITRFDRRRNMSFEVQNRMREHFGAELCETVISENVAVAEAPAMNRDMCVPLKSCGRFTYMLNDAIVCCSPAVRC